MISRAILLLTGLLLAPGVAAGQEPGTVTRDASGRPTLRALRLTEPLRIDGRLDEAPYGAAPHITRLIQVDPQNGQPASQTTEVWVSFDRDHFNVSVRVGEDHPERMVANDMRHDAPQAQQEVIVVAIDTFHDRRNASVFMVNALGGRSEGQVANERAYNGDWNGIWDADVGRFEGGWTVEMAIPFKTLRYQPGAAQEWGLQVQRINRWRNETSFMAPSDPARGNLGFMLASRFGTVTGVEAPRPAMNLEIKPYAIGQLRSDRLVSPAVSNDPDGDAGLDVKYGVTPSLTADVTVNTDFAQVEADEQQVNLTRFSLFFPEKREFFLENSGTFAFGGTTTGALGVSVGDAPLLFYSRRVGLNGAAEVPLLAGGRLTGRLGRYNVGVLDIQSKDEPLSRARATNFSVVRVRRDILRRSAIGVLATARSVAQNGVGSNQTYGVDGVAVAQSNIPVISIAPTDPLSSEVLSRDAEGLVTLRATRIADPITVDGRLDDAVYGTVKAAADFIQQEPNEGEPASQRTEVWVLFDDDNIYISCRCWDSDMAQIVANDMRRDSQNLVQQDNIMVIFDTFHDGRNGFLFSVTPIGGMSDGLVTDERQLNNDWNTVWDARVAREDWGWTAEMAIPFKSLRYRPGPAQTWGVNVRRTIRRYNEWAYLTRVPASFGIDGIYKVSGAVTLVGLEVPSSGRNLEIKPYAISGLRTDLTVRPAARDELNTDAGVDLKVGLTRSLTADVTYRTDFAQVEADEQQVNLTRFNLLFPEKRDFFLEGQGIFSFGGVAASGSAGGLAGNVAPIMFFSRRIGLNEGRPVSIRAGARLTGKVGRYSIGVLNTQVGEEPLTQSRSTNFSVVRLRGDVFRRSSIGVIATGRSVSTVGTGGNALVGFDGVFSFFDNVNVNTYVAKTRTPGLDGQDTSYRAQFDYRGDRYSLVVDRLVVDEHFNPEVGFLARENFKRNFGQARFSPRPRANGPFGAVRRFTFGAHYEYTTDGDNRLETREFFLGPLQAQFQSSDSVAVGFGRVLEFIPRPFSLAEGVVIPAGVYRHSFVRSVDTLGQQRRISGLIDFQHGSFYGGRKTTVTFRNSRIEITPQLTFEPGVSVNWIDLPSGPLTTRLVSTRATYTATPRMFITALVQFNSSTTSFNSNVRLRWEYRPGSELFLVYTEGRDTLMSGSPLENRGLVVKVNRLFRF